MAVLWLKTQTPISFLTTEGVHIWQNDCLVCVDYKVCLNNQYSLGVKGQGYTYTYNLSNDYNCEPLFQFLTKNVHVCLNECQWCVDYNKAFRSPI